LILKGVMNQGGGWPAPPRTIPGCMLAFMQSWIWKGGQVMGKKRYAAEQIIVKFWEAGIELPKGNLMASLWKI
jgi:hypothetical protein